MAYSLLETIRRPGLKSITLERAQVHTIRLELIEIGAVIARNSRRVRFLPASACPYRQLFILVAQRLAPI